MKDPKPIKALGHSFPTERIAARARELHTFQSAGAVSGLKFHPKLKLSPAGLKFKVDFFYLEKGREIYEDYKTEKDPRFKDLVKLWAIYGPGTLRLTAWRRGRVVTVREIERTETPEGEIDGNR